LADGFTVKESKSKKNNISGDSFGKKVKTNKKQNSDNDAFANKTKKGKKKNASGDSFATKSNKKKNNDLADGFGSNDGKRGVNLDGDAFAGGSKVTIQSLKHAHSKNDFIKIYRDVLSKLKISDLAIVLR
jgi:hypothetical protein